MFYPQEILEELRSLNDIQEVVSSYIPLKQKGNIFFGLCPFHNEKTPSFSVTPEKQMYYCYGCGASGNVYSFVMQNENCTFPEAIKILADRINYKLPEENLSEEMIKNAKTRENLYSINKITAKFFFNSLAETSFASTYLDKRSVPTNIRRRFGLGFAPKEKDLLLNTLLKQGFQVEDILKTGLIYKSKNGNYLEKFYSRLMFPIFEPSGKIVGFGGRVLDDTEPKYLNSPDSQIFNKSKNLYGINLAKKSKKDEYILAEGYFDVITLHAAGFTNSVAALGTSFNKEHAKLLKKYVSNVVVLFDSDEAGLNATLRAIKVLLQTGFKIRVLTLKEAKDPDEFLKNYGAKAFEKALSVADNHIMFQINLLKNSFNPKNTDDKLLFTEKAMDIIKDVENAVEIDTYSKVISDITGIEKTAIKEEVSKIYYKNDVKKPVFVKQKYTSEKGIIDCKKNILFLIAANIFIVDKIKEHLLPSEMEDEVYEKMLNLLYNFAKNSTNVYPAELLNYFHSPEEQKKVSEVFNTVKDTYNKENLEKAVNDLLKTLKKYNISQKFASITDSDEIKKLMDLRKNVETLYITI